MVPFLLPLLRAPVHLLLVQLLRLSLTSILLLFSIYGYLALLAQLQSGRFHDQLLPLANEQCHL
jgi:hypothetical protein